MQFDSKQKLILLICGMICLAAAIVLLAIVSQPNSILAAIFLCIVCGMLGACIPKLIDYINQVQCFRALRGIVDHYTEWQENHPDMDVEDYNNLFNPPVRISISKEEHEELSKQLKK